LLHALRPGHVDALHQVVQRTAELLQPVHLLGLHRDATAGRKDRLEAGANGRGADDTPAAGVHADDFIVVGPDGHQALDVAMAQRQVELGLQFVGTARGGGSGCSDNGAAGHGPSGRPRTCGR
jgi:hypothetical protein